MRIGLQIPKFTWPGGDAGIATRLADIARTADEGGFYSLWVMDHFFQIRNVGEYTEPMLESYTTLGYLAGLTKKARLGTMVTGVIYRHPGILVKEVTTLDVLSGGRAYLGVGAAWNEQEATGLGIPFPPLKERFERLEEALRIAKQMWAGDTKPFQGKYYQLGEPVNQPMPISKPHPPILIGGMGEKKTMRFVAKYADACNLFARAGQDVLQQRLDLIKRYCDEYGRSHDEIERTALSGAHLAPGQMTVKDVIAHCQELAKLGFQQTIFNMPNVQDIKPLETFAREIIPAVANL
ncbi:MAG TPA: LLM class F420-dependent oxidoreductase [Aggregatilineales bacterium]|nr:LLM class F420-dependent oxidoreductase [Aggregatilineales bacterium]